MHLQAIRSINIVLFCTIFNSNKQPYTVQGTVPAKEENTVVNGASPTKQYPHIMNRQPIAESKGPVTIHMMPNNVITKNDFTSGVKVSPTGIKATSNGMPIMPSQVKNIFLSNFI